MIIKEKYEIINLTDNKREDVTIGSDADKTKKITDVL